MSRNRDLGVGPVLTNVTTAAITATWQADHYLMTILNTGVCTVTLDPNPADGDEFRFLDYLKKAATNNLTINPSGTSAAGNPIKIYAAGVQASTLVISVNGSSPRLVYSNALGAWIADTTVVS